jgi:hypothetical protein
VLGRHLSSTFLPFVEATVENKKKIIGNIIMSYPKLPPASHILRGMKEDDLSLNTAWSEETARRFGGGDESVLPPLYCVIQKLPDNTGNILLKILSLLE